MFLFAKDVNSDLAVLDKRGAGMFRALSGGLYHPLRLYHLMKPLAVSSFTYLES